ncbi:UMP kinase activity protein [Homalodisca vitripennis]|nr:UMP kinase activity protein [Homalodisca vitripennis]
MILNFDTFHISYQIIFLFWLATHYGANGQESPPEVTKKPSFFNMNNVNELFNLEHLLDEFNGPRLCRVPGVTDMMTRYNETVKKSVNLSTNVPMKPFIAIESVYNAGRRTVTELVAHALGGVYSTNPPKIMQGFSTAFDGMFIRRKYYALSKYASSNLVRGARLFNPVVMEKYYYDQAVFIIAKTYIDTNLPPADDPIYDWPPDLLKPDLVFFLNYPDDPTTNLFTQKMVTLFRTMRDPPVVEIDAGHSVHIMANDIIHNINSALGTEYPLLSDHPREPPKK